jgi:hypothetical protein
MIALMRLVMKIGVGLLGFAAFVQAADVPIGTFAAGAPFNAVLSNASAGGFTVTYPAPGSDSRAYAYSVLDAGSAVDLAVGESLTFSFDWSSTQITNNSSAVSAFRIGFDTGSGIFMATVDTQPSYTYLTLRYGDTYQFGSTTSAGFWQTTSSPGNAMLPASADWLVAGNTPTITTILTRSAAEDWKFVLEWGGQTYSADISGYAAADGTIDRVWVGSGDASTPSFSDDDNYTISNAQVTRGTQAKEASLFVISAE